MEIKDEELLITFEYPLSSEKRIEGVKLNTITRAEYNPFLGRSTLASPSLKLRVNLWKDQTAVKSFIELLKK